MIISLLGYMGSGKSHIAKLLSSRLQLTSIDLDDEISSEVGMSIAEFFSKFGELKFRKVEQKVLSKILNSEEDFILSLGGGTPVYFNNMEITNAASDSFYLRASISTLVQRLLPEKEHRPMIARITDEDLPEFIAKHLFERNIFYNQAKHILDVDGKTDADIVEEIINILYPPR